MTGTRVGMTGGAKGMTERVNIGKDGEKPVGETRGRTVERTGIPGRAGNDGERAKEMMRKRTGMTERKQRENSGKGEGRTKKGSPGENRMNKRK